MAESLSNGEIMKKIKLFISKFFQWWKIIFKSAQEVNEVVETVESQVKVPEVKPSKQEGFTQEQLDKSYKDFQKKMDELPDLGKKP